LSLIGRHSSGRIVSSVRNAPYVAILVDGLAMFIGVEIDRQIDWLRAN
jgi:hypothetical protein